MSISLTYFSVWINDAAPIIFFQQECKNLAFQYSRVSNPSYGLCIRNFKRPPCTTSIVWGSGFWKYINRLSNKIAICLWFSIFPHAYKLPDHILIWVLVQLQQDELWSKWVDLAFQKLDINGDGFIDLNELVSKLPVDDDVKGSTAKTERVLEVIFLPRHLLQ